MGLGAGWRRQSTRYAALDILRAVALVSMVSLHVTGDRTLVTRVLHGAKWIDGAFYFVALSGVVTGLVHRRIVERSGMIPSTIKLGRRAGLIYGVHVALVCLIITVHSVLSSAVIPTTPTWSQDGRPFHTVEQVLMLRVQPESTNILPMYVFFLLWAIVAVRLLARGRYSAVIALSVAAYAGGTLVHGGALVPGNFQILRWQLLFTGGLLVGWAWEHERRVVPARSRRMLLGIAVTASVGLFVLTRLAPRSVESLPGSPVDKMSGGWLSFLFAGAVLVVGYAVIETLRRLGWARRALGPVAILGSKGLPGYVAMVISLLVLAVAPAIGRNDLIVLLVVLVCGLTELTALRVDDWRRGRVRPPSPSPEPTRSPWRQEAPELT